MDNETSFSKCDGCGGYHPEAEMQVVVLKLRKGRDCKLDNVLNQKPAINLPRLAIPQATETNIQIGGTGGMPIPTMTMNVNGENVDPAVLRNILNNEKPNV